MACKAIWPNGSWKGMVCGYPLETPYHEITSTSFSHGYEEGDPSMTTKTATTEIDPTTLPVITPKAKRTPKATATGTPTNIATARAARKRARLTGDDYKQARDFARKTTGYNETSPIWGKRLIEVLVEIEALLDFGTPNAHAPMTQKERVDQALLFNRELQKRLATGQLIAAQS